MSEVQGHRNFGADGGDGQQDEEKRQRPYRQHVQRGTRNRRNRHTWPVKHRFTKGEGQGKNEKCACKNGALSILWAFLGDKIAYRLRLTLVEAEAILDRK